MKKILALILSLVACLSVLTFIGCGGTSVNDKGFKKGYAVNFIVNEEITIKDLVDNQKADFKLVAEKEGEESIDLTETKKWRLQVVGTWTLKLDILDGANKGSYSIDINIQGLPLDVYYTDDKVTATGYKRAGETLNFADFLKDVNAMDNFDYGKCDLRVFTIIKKNVENGTVEFKLEDTGYEFPDRGTYAIIFGAQAEDGQICKKQIDIKVG